MPLPPPTVKFPPIPTPPTTCKAPVLVVPLLIELVLILTCPLDTNKDHLLVASEPPVNNGALSIYTVAASSHVGLNVPAIVGRPTLCIATTPELEPVDVASTYVDGLNIRPAPTLLRIFLVTVPLRVIVPET
jgi:hypothetical protein